MLSSITNKKCKSITWQYCRPALLGLLTAFTVTFLLIALFSLFFVILETIADSAIIPLALLSAAAGCFIGAYICSYMTKCHGLLLGLFLALIMFAIIWLIGLFASDAIFGTENAIKLVLLSLAGSIGGWLGCSAKPRKR